MIIIYIYIYDAIIWWYDDKEHVRIRKGHLQFSIPTVIQGQCGAISKFPTVQGCVKSFWQSWQKDKHEIVYLGSVVLQLDRRSQQFSVFHLILFYQIKVFWENVQKERKKLTGKMDKTLVLASSCSICNIDVNVDFYQTQNFKGLWACCCVYTYRIKTGKIKQKSNFWLLVYGSDLDKHVLSDERREVKINLTI